MDSGAETYGFTSSRPIVMAGTPEALHALPTFQVLSRMDLKVAAGGFKDSWKIGQGLRYVYGDHLPHLGNRFFPQPRSAALSYPKVLFFAPGPGRDHGSARVSSFPHCVSNSDAYVQITETHATTHAPPQHHGPTSRTRH